MTEIQCPTCQKITAKDSAHKPFCCKRCREADLLGWVNGDYAISREITYEDLEDPALEGDRDFLIKHLNSLGSFNPYGTVED